MRLALPSGATPGLSLPLRELVSPVQRLHLSSLSLASLYPRRSLISSPYLLPVSFLAPSVSFSLSQIQPIRRPGLRDPTASASPRPPPPGLPLSLAASGRPCHRPLPGPHTPCFLAVPSEKAPGGDRLGALPPPSRRPRRPGLGGGPALWAPASPPPAPVPARRAPGRMGCTVSLVCCEALEPGPPCSPQPPGSPPAPARAQGWEPGASARAESKRLLLQVGRCGDGCGERVAGRAQLT